MGIEPKAGDPPVWARGDLVLTACPIPLIRGESIAYLAAYALFRQGVGAPAEQLSAKCADAFQLIRGLVAQAEQNGDGAVIAPGAGERKGR